MPDEVYVVMMGEKHEGGSIEDIFYHLSDALKCAESVRAHFPEGWVVVPNNPEDVNSFYYAENGCDWCRVIKYRIL